MSVPIDVLELLKCNNCNNYLSYFPIITNNNNISICGRCTSDEEEPTLTIRNIIYENLASVIEFPCKYQRSGCCQVLRPSYIPEHEEDCRYSPIECPFLCKSSKTWPDLLEHCQDIHKDSVLESSLLINLDKDFSTTFLFAPDNYQEIFVVKIEFLKRTLVTSFWNSGGSRLENLNCKLIVVTDKDLYYPLVTSTRCNKYRNINQQLEALINKASILLDLETHRAVIHFEIEHVYPEYKDVVLSSFEIMDIDINMLELPNIYYKCKHEDQGCVFSSNLNSEVKEHEEKCNFSNHNIVPYDCIMCIQQLAFPNHDSIWSHYVTSHHERILLNNQKMAWRPAVSGKSFLLNFKNYIFSLNMVKRIVNGPNLFWSVQLVHQPDHMSKKFSFKITFLNETTESKQMLLFTKPVYHQHDCLWPCPVCRDSLFISQEMLRDFIIDKRLHFIIEIITK